MKKRILTGAAALLMVVLLTVLLLPSDTTQTDIPTGTTGSTASTTQTHPVPTTSIVVTPTGTSLVTSPPPTTTLPPEPGVVRLYTCDREKYEVYVTLAAEYYAQTGTEVLVLTPAEGQSCAEALTGLLSGETPPTVFCIHSAEMLTQLQSGLYNLTGTAAADALYSGAFACMAEGKTVALAVDVTGSGLLYNAALLAQPVGFTQSDIHGFTDLQYIFDYITANRSRLGVYTLAAPDYNDAALMQTLAGLFADADQLRSFVDLYIRNTTSRSTTLNYFLKGTTVFYIGTTEDYETVASLGGNNLGFLPAYAAGSDAVQCVCEHYWAVNGAVSDADAQASVDFLGWLVTAGDGGAPVDRLQMLSPYRDAVYSANALQKQLRAYIAAGDARVNWRVSGAVTDTEAFSAALKVYVSSATDENWAAVAAAFG